MALFAVDPKLIMRLQKLSRENLRSVPKLLKLTGRAARFLDGARKGGFPFTPS